MIANRMLPELTHAEMTVIASNDSSAVDRLSILLEQARKEEEYKANLRSLLTGNVLTPTEIAHSVNAMGLLKLRKSGGDVNNLLIEGGYQTRDKQVLTLRGVTKEITSYLPTSTTIECNLGITQTVGSVRSIRWDACMINIVLEIAIETEKEDEAVTETSEENV